MSSFIDRIKTLDSFQFSSCPRCGEKRKTTDAQVHAPKGGVTVLGKKFVGGQFIPKEGGYQEAFLKKNKGGEQSAVQKQQTSEQKKEPASKKEDTTSKKATATIKKQKPKKLLGTAEDVYREIASKGFDNVSISGPDSIFANKDLRNLDWNKLYRMLPHGDSSLNLSNFSGSNLEGVVFPDLISFKGVDFSNCNLRNARFGKQTSLYKVDFTGADVTGADFSRIEELHSVKWEKAKCSYMSPESKAVFDEMKFETDLFEMDGPFDLSNVTKKHKKQVGELLSKAAGVDPHEVNLAVHSWASSSGDSEMRSVASQIFAKKIFNLGEATTDNLDYHTKKKVTPLLEAEKGLGKDLRKIIKAQYDKTQEWFAKHGFKPDDRILLYRGLHTGRELKSRLSEQWSEVKEKFTPEEQLEIHALYREKQRGEEANKNIVDDYTKHLLKNHTQEELDKALDYQEGIYGKSRYPKKEELIGTVRLQPLSSFSVKYSVAEGFAESTGKIFACHVPVKEIFSHPQTGYGCTTEREMVVLGGIKKYVDVTADKNNVKLLFEESQTQDAKPDPIEIDADLENADWVKHSWDLPEFGSEEFNQFLKNTNTSLEHFKTLPVYKHYAKNKPEKKKQVLENFLSKRKSNRLETKTSGAVFKEDFGSNKKTTDEQIHAPKGGVTIKGKHFKGGEFIPSEGGYAEEYKKQQTTKKEQVPKITELDKALLQRKIKRNNKLYEIFNEHIHSGPLDGGCYAMAKALQNKLGGELYTLTSNKGGEHIVLKSGEDYWDGDGKSTKEQLLKRWEEQEGIKNPSLKPFDENDVPDSPRNRDLINAVTTHIGGKAENEPDQKGKVTFTGLGELDKAHVKLINDLKMSEQNLNEVLSFPGYTNQVRYSFRKSVPGEVMVVAKAKNAAGETIDTTLSSDRDKPDDLHLNYLEVSSKGTGTAKEYLKKLEDFVRKTGKRTLSLDADISIGWYAWAKMGFNADEPEAVEVMKRRLIRYAAKVLSLNGERDYSKEMGQIEKGVSGLKTVEDICDYNFPNTEFTHEQLKKIGYENQDVPADLKMHLGKSFMTNQKLSRYTGYTAVKNVSGTQDSMGAFFNNELETKDDEMKKILIVTGKENFIPEGSSDFEFHKDVLLNAPKKKRTTDKASVLSSFLIRRRKTTDAQVHAPAGGVTIKGKRFEGGEFIPAEGGYAEEYKKQQKEQSTEKQESVKQEKSAEKNNSQETFKKKYPHVSNVKVFKEGLAKEEAAEKALSLRKKNIFASKGSSSVHEKLNDYLNKRKPANIIDISGYSQNADEISKEQRMNQADFSDIQTQMKNNLSEVRKTSVKTTPVKGQLSQNHANIIKANAQNELNSYSSYLAADTALRARDFVDDYKRILERGMQDGSLKDVDSEYLNELCKDSLQKLLHQEVESNRQMFTDHGIRHVVGDAIRAKTIAEIMNPDITAKELLLLNFIAVNHDVGYTTPLIREGGNRAVAISKDHMAFSQKIAGQQKDKWNSGRIFTPEEYNKALEIIGSHDSTKLDREDVLGTSMRLSDNLSLFGSEKLPSAFRYVDGGEDLLVKMGEAAKENNLENFDNLKQELYKKIDESNFNQNLKRDLKASVKELTHLTPKFTMGTLAGEISSIQKDKTGVVDITIQHDKFDQLLQKMFDMGQRQTKKLLEDYGIKDFNQTSYDLGGVVRLNVIKTTDNQTVDEFVESEHPRAESGSEKGGQFVKKGSGSSGKSKQASTSYKPLSAKAERAKKAYVPATKERQAIADKMEYEVAKLIPKSQRTANNSPFDIIAGNIALEVKTMLVATNDRVHMRKDSRLRKEEFLRKNKKMRGGVLLIDKREKEKITVYFKEGVGAFRIGTMSKAEGTDLKTALSKLNLFGGN